MSAITVVTCVVLSTVVAFLVGHLSKPTIATLDLGGIVELEQIRMSAVVMRPETSEEDRMKAMSRVKSFGGILEAAISEVQHECGCVLMSRNAVVASTGPDLTEAVKAKVGLAGFDAQSAKESVERSISRRIPTADDMQRKAQEARAR